MDVRCVVQ
jgi:pectinesterase